MSSETLLFILAIIFIVGSIPSWPYSKSWGYAPSGVLSILLIIFLVWAIAGNRPLFRSETLSDAGHDLKSAGQDIGDSVRRTIQ